MDCTPHGANLKALCIIPTYLVFYLRPLETSAHLFNYSPSGNSVPSMCQALKIQPGISQTPSCTELTIGLCLLSLCQLPPTFSSLHILLPSLDPQAPHSIAHLLMCLALCASLLPGRNQPWATQHPAFSAPAHTGKRSSQAAELKPQSNSLNFSQALFFHLGNPHLCPYHLSPFLQMMNVSDFLYKP